MHHQPIELDRDRDSSDPLNPTVNYTHFNPSPEQQDPRIPLGFKIYGIGCLAAFLTFLLLSVIFVIFNKRFKRFWRSRRQKQGEKELSDLGKPSLPKSLETGTEVNGLPEKSNFPEDHTTLSPPPICTSSSYEGESARWRGKPREAGSWDSCNTVVNVESPHLGLTPHPPSGTGGIPNAYSPIFTSNPYTPTPHATYVSSRLPHLDSPVSPRTIPAKPYYISPLEPVKAVTTDGAHRTAQATRRTPPLKSNHFPGDERLDIFRNERQSLPSVASGRSSVSSRKGILKTSPTYVARNSSQSLPYPSLSSDGTLASTSTREGLSGVSQLSSSTNPFKGSITSRSISSVEGLSSNLIDKSYPSTCSGAPATTSVVALSPTSSQESHIVNLGPDPNLACCGSSGALARRVTISIPSRSSVKGDKKSSYEDPSGNQGEFQPHHAWKGWH